MIAGGAGRTLPSFIALVGNGWKADIIARNGPLESHAASGDDESSLLLRFTASPYDSEPWETKERIIRNLIQLHGMTRVI